MTRKPFPLVPSWRVAGAPFGRVGSLRRGRGADVAGSRPYVPGDSIATIDWRASARLATARHRDEFVVRERYNEEAPPVVVVQDRSASCGLYPVTSPWLHKPAVVASAVEAIRASAAAAGSSVGWADVEGEKTVWRSPRSSGARARLHGLAAATFDATPGAFTRAIARTAAGHGELPPGTFVFAFSDFLATSAVRALRQLRGFRWHVVPVVVQDPTWEAAFPQIGRAEVPIASPDGERRVILRLSAADARLRAEQNRGRLASILADFARARFEPVVLTSVADTDVDAAFARWARVRERRAGGRG